MINKGELHSFHALQQLCRRCLMKEVGLAIDQVVPVRRIPKTTSGKIQHYLLVEAYRAGEFSEALRELSAIAPQATAEK